MEDFDKDQEEKVEVEEEEFEGAEEQREEEMESRFGELNELLDARQFSKFAHELGEMNPVDVADFISPNS